MLGMASVGVDGVDMVFAIGGTSGGNVSLKSPLPWRCAAGRGLKRSGAACTGDGPVPRRLLHRPAVPGRDRRAVLPRRARLEDRLPAHRPPLGPRRRLS